MLNTGVITVSYIIATILFILALGGLSNQETARRGNWYGIVGMAIALLATILGIGNALLHEIQSLSEDGCRNPVDNQPLNRFCNLDGLFACLVNHLHRQIPVIRIGTGQLGHLYGWHQMGRIEPMGDHQTPFIFYTGTNFFKGQ